MSLGSNYNNNSQKDYYNPTVYSAYRMNNAESLVDKTCLTFGYWKSVLRISISPKKDTGNDDVSFDMDNGISIYLNHTKARILAERIRAFLQNPEANDNTGVPSGQGLITISRGKEYNSTHPLLIIRKIDQENGNVISSFAYEFKGSDYYYAISNYVEGGSFDKVSDEFANLEIEQLITILEEYYKAMTSAVAYSVIDQMKYSETRVMNRLNKIAEKLGVELSSGGKNGGGNYSSTSYFNRQSSSQSSGNNNGYTQATLDDIE